MSSLQCDESGHYWPLNSPTCECGASTSSAYEPPTLPDRIKKILRVTERQTVITMARRANDFYQTPHGATLALLDSIGPLSRDTIAYEPCAGKNSITNVLWNSGLHSVWTNDIDPKVGWKLCFNVDASTVWPMHGKTEPVDWVITNPPFNKAYEILQLSLQNCDKVALLLRLSFLEPTAKRANFLREFPPTKLLVLPRMSFTENGKTDSVTYAWMVWEAGQPEQAIKVYTRNDLVNLVTKYRESKYYERRD